MGLLHWSQVKVFETLSSKRSVEQRLEDVVHPATLNQVAHFQRERTLNLSVMMAFVLSLIWRQIGSVTEAVQTLNREGLYLTIPAPP
jgi:hypothetical protein